MWTHAALLLHVPLPPSVAAVHADGELRQPGPDIMQKLSGAKEKLGLRVHGLIVGSPDKKRADPAVLRSLCTNYLPNGKVELCLSEFEGWASVQVSHQPKLMTLRGWFT